MADLQRHDGPDVRKDAHSLVDTADDVTVLVERKTVNRDAEALRELADELDRLSEQKAVGANELTVDVATRVVMDAKADALQMAAERAREMAEEVDADE